MHARVRASGFTLLEMLVVIAIVALIASTVAVGVARTSPERSMSRSLEQVVTAISIARVEAMQRGRAETVEMWVTLEDLRLARGDAVRSWKVAGVDLAEPKAVTTRFLREEAPKTRFGGLTADFDTMGRTRARRWEVWYHNTPGRIWAIEFDPVSGAPSMVAPGA